MRQSHPQLFQTERRLVRLFVIGIFLFLLVFEAIFLGSRMYLENRMQVSDFQINSDRIIQNLARGELSPVEGPKGDGRRPMGIGFLLLDGSGTIVRNRLAGQDTQNITEIIDEHMLQSTPENQIVLHDHLLIRKIPLADNGGSILFISETGYDTDGLLRDMFRFLLLDLLILIPFYFMARIYVRETLEPVKENLDTMTHFVHDAGHELKTPLAIISGNLQFIRDSKKSDPELIIESLSTIDGMNDSIEGLLELADLKLPDKKNKVILKHVIDTEISKLRDEYSSITLEDTISEKVIVHASERHLSILLRNLIENALKYNHDGGSVTIKYEKGVLKIIDTGIGIAPEEQERIFDRFYRANAGSGKSGSGIGLTLVDRIAKLYGWTLSVESILGEGTTIGVKF